MVAFFGCSLNDKDLEFPYYPENDTVTHTYKLWLLFLLTYDFFPLCTNAYFVIFQSSSKTYFKPFCSRLQSYYLYYTDLQNSFVFNNLNFLCRSGKFSKLLKTVKLPLPPSCSIFSRRIAIYLCSSVEWLSSSRPSQNIRFLEWKTSKQI